jgi:hypothetical protein
MQSDGFRHTFCWCRPFWDRQRKVVQAMTKTNAAVVVGMVVDSGQDGSTVGTKFQARVDQNGSVK